MWKRPVLAEIELFADSFNVQCGKKECGCFCPLPLFLSTTSSEFPAGHYDRKCKTQDVFFLLANKRNRGVIYVPEMTSERQERRRKGPTKTGKNRKAGMSFLKADRMSREERDETVFLFLFTPFTVMPVVRDFSV